MPVTTKHPQWTDSYEDWRMMDDALKGERWVKLSGVLYLPKTSAMVAAEAGTGAITKDEAEDLYHGYKRRADYPLWVKDALRAMIGLASRQEPEIVLPPQLASLETAATADGFGLKELFLRVVSAELVRGRDCLLGDFDDDGNPYIAEYTAQSAINWMESAMVGRRDLSLVVLQEERISPAADSYSHETVEVYRVLDMVEGRARVRVVDQSGADLEDEREIGRLSGERMDALPYLPVVFVGPTDNGPDVDEIPLLSMAKSALKYYQLSADYYTSLHYTSHPQPVVTGLHEDDELRITGPALAWLLPEGGTANYLEFEGNGIGKLREAMRDQRDAAMEAGARVLDAQTEESGEARRARQDDQHTTLYGVVMQAAAGIEQMLRYLAEWAGANPDDVSFKVVPEFSKADVDAALLTVIGNLTMAGETPRSVLYEALRKAQVTDLSDEQLDAERDTGMIGAMDDAE